MDIARIDLGVEEVWQSRLHREHPDLQAEVTAFRFLEDHSCICVVHLEGAGAAEAVRVLRRHPRVADLHLLQQEPREALLSLRVEGLPDALARADVLFQPPFLLQGGRLHFTVLGSRERIQSLLRVFDGLGLPYRLGSIRPGRERRPRPLLTSHQERVIRYALQRGYYDVPRRADLADLSGKLGLSRSGLSELLRRGERRLLSDYFGNL